MVFRGEDYVQRVRNLTTERPIAVEAFLEGRSVSAILTESIMDGLTMEADTSSSTSSSSSIASTSVVSETVPVVDAPWMRMLAYLMFSAFAIIELIVVLLSWQRRNRFPLTAIPIVWHISAHLSFVVGMFANFSDTLTPKENRCKLFFALNVLSPFAMGSLVAQFFYIWFKAYLQHISVTQQTTSKWIVKQNQLKVPLVVFLFVIITSWGTSYAIFLAYATDTYSRETCKPTVADIGISSAGPLIAVMGILIGAFKLRKIQEAFDLKSQYKKFAICLILMSLLGGALGAANKIIGEFLRDTMISAGFFGFAFFCGYRPLRRSYEEERRRDRILRRRTSSQISSMSSQRVSPGLLGRPAKSLHELKYLLTQRTDLLEGLIVYAVKEFCVENPLFLRSLYDYQREMKATIRVQKAQHMANSFLVEGTVTEINVGMALRKLMLDKISTLTEVEAVPELFDVVENEVLGMLLDPFNRYLMAEGILLTGEDFKGADVLAVQRKQSGYGRHSSVTSTISTTPVLVSLSSSVEI